VGQPEGEPFAPLIAVAQVPPERVAVPSFVPKQHIATLPGYTKPGNLCEPSAGRKRGIELRPEAGQKDRSGRSMRATLPAPPPFPCTPHTETKGWRATAVKPFQPLPSEVLPIVVRVQPGIFAANPPKQALRELALPSARPWHSLALPWESLEGFHFAMPMAEETNEVRLQAPSSITPWTSSVDADIPGQQLLRESTQVPFELPPLLEGTRTPLTRSRVAEAVVPTQPGLNEPLRGRREPVQAEPFVKAKLSEKFPLPILAKTPLPVIGLPDGLLIWTENINSYRRRIWCSSRLREGGRSVQTLQLGPSMQLDTPFEMSTT
jgi:hypothetical protein